MLNFFRTNQLAFNLFLIVYVLLLRGTSFFQPPVASAASGSGVLSDWIYNLIGYDGIPAIVLSIVLVFLQAVLINIVIARFRIAGEVTLFPGLVYIMLVSACPVFLQLSPLIMANTFFILALLELYKIYRNKSSAGNIFNIGFWIGIASLFYFSEMIFIIWSLFGISILRAFRPSEFIIAIIGFFIPLFLAGAFYFWNDSFLWFLQRQFANNFGFFDLNMQWGLQTYITLSFMVCLLLIVFLGSGSFFIKKNIQVQKNISLLYWALFFGAGSVLIQANITLLHLLILIVPLSVLLSFRLSKLSPATAEATHLVLLIGILIWQSQGLWS